ncbi:MAG: hypothetical protein ACK5M9_01025, partial [Mycobacterium sp.]
LAALAVAGPAALATGPGLAGLRAAVEAVPALGVLRDGQKWVGLAMPGYTLAAAAAVLTLRHRMPAAVTATACCLALVLALPDLAWGAWGRVTAVHYPPGWARVAARINAEPGRPGSVAVLPSGTMRRFDWSGAAPVLDPLPRWVRAEVLTTGDLVIAGITVPGEGDRARTVRRLLLAGAEPSELAAAGVSWLVVESDTPGDMGAANRTVSRLPRAYRDRRIALYRVGGQTPGASAGVRDAALAAHLGWLVLLVVGGAGATVRSRR